MTSVPHYTWLPHLQQGSRTLFRVQFGRNQAVRPPLDHLAQHLADLPRFVQQSAVAMRYLRLLGVLDSLRALHRVRQKKHDEANP